MGTHTPRRLCKATASPHPLSEIHLSLLLLLILRWDQTFGGTDQALEQIKMESTNFYPTIPLTLIIKTNVFTKLEKVGQLEKSVYYLKSLNICELKSVNWHIQWNEHLALELSYDLGLGCSPLFCNSIDYDSSYPWIRLTFVHLIGVRPVQTYCWKTNVSISLPSPTSDNAMNMSIGYWSHITSENNNFLSLYEWKFKSKFRSNWKYIRF